MAENDNIEAMHDALAPIAFVSPKTSEVIVTYLQDGSVRYSCNYLMNGNLPKLNAVILDPISKWNGHPKVSLEFKKDLDLTPVYSSLKLLNATYEHRDIYGAIDIVRITSNSIPTIAYLSNLYNSASREASTLLSQSLPPMINWAIDKDKPTLAQDFGIWMAHWSDPEETPKLQAGSSKYCLTHMTCEYKNITLYLEEQNKLAIENNYKAQYRQMSTEDKTIQYNALINAVVNMRTQEILAEMDVQKIQRMLKSAEYEQASSVFNSIEQCTSYLYNKYPEIKPSAESNALAIRNELAKLEAPRINLDTFSKNTKDTTSIIGTLIFDIGLKIVDTGGAEGAAVAAGAAAAGAAVIMPSVIPVIGAVLSTAKLIACISSLASRNGWINLADKESSQKINRDDLVKEFSCKATVCNIKKFANLTEDGQTSLAKFFGQYIYNSLKDDKHQYHNQSVLVDSLLDKLSHHTHFSAIKIDKFLSHELSTSNGGFVSLSDYLTDYNQATCYDDIQSKLAGETTTSASSI